MANGLGQEAIDQAAHFAAGFIIGAISVLLGLSFQSGIANATAFGFGREIGQHGNVMPWELGRGSWLDIAFWALGGIAGAWLAQ